MCVIAIKPRDVDLPAEEKLKLMWDRNSDGAGYMYALEGDVYIEKGFMTFEDFKQGISLLKEKLEEKNLSFTDLPMVMHFRITTHGGTSPENTHPFPLSDREEHLKGLDLVAKLGMAHNGVISTVEKNDNLSDTQMYIKDILYPLSVVDSDFTERFNKLISATIGASKLAFLYANGDIITFGNFTEKEGLLYSNTFWVPYVNTTKTYYRNDKYTRDSLVLDENKKYKITDKYTTPNWLSELKGKVLIWKPERNTKYNYNNYFLVEGDEKGKEWYIGELYIEEIKEDKKKSKEDDEDTCIADGQLLVENDKNNIGGKNNIETYAIKQNANRALYDKTVVKQGEKTFFQISRYICLLTSEQYDNIKVGNYAFFGDVTETASGNWYADDEKVYYKQKDGALIEVEDIVGTAYLDYDDYVLTATKKVSTTYIELRIPDEGIEVYTIKKGV